MRASTRLRNPGSSTTVGITVGRAEAEAGCVGIVRVRALDRRGWPRRSRSSGVCASSSSRNRSPARRPFYWEHSGHSSAAGCWPPGSGCASGGRKPRGQMRRGTVQRGKSQGPLIPASACRGTMRAWTLSAVFRSLFTASAMAGQARPPSNARLSRPMGWSEPMSTRQRKRPTWTTTRPRQTRGCSPGRSSELATGRPLDRDGGDAPRHQRFGGARRWLLGRRPDQSARVAAQGRPGEASPPMGPPGDLHRVRGQPSPTRDSGSPRSARFGRRSERSTTRMPLRRRGSFNGSGTDDCVKLDDCGTKAAVSDPRGKGVDMTSCDAGGGPLRRGAAEGVG